MWRRITSSSGLIVLVCFVQNLALARTSVAAPCTLTAQDIDNYLHGKSSPLEGLGALMLQKGHDWNVDPRLLLAIAGTETTFGTNLGCNTQYNAWSWFTTGVCSTSTFASYDEALTSVAKGLRLKYLNQGLDTLDLIGGKYCTAGCDNWLTLAKKFYHDELLGDLNDLGCAPECTASSCGNFVACATPASGCQDPVCVQLAEPHGGQCVEGTTPCAGLSDCSSSHDCYGGVCAVATCCGRNVCVSPSAFCSSNAQNSSAPTTLDQNSGPTIGGE